MVWQRDVDLVVPLGHGSDDVRVVAGAAALARLIPTNGDRLHISVSDKPRTTTDGICNLDTVADTLHRLRQRLTSRNPHRALTLGGDCTADTAAIHHLAAHHPNLTLYWVDAHADLNTPATSPSAKAHGMGLRLLLGEGHPRLLGGPALAPSRVSLIGTHGMARIDPLEIITDPASATAAHPVGTPAYIHLDIDVCDPYDLPAVSCPSPQGPTAATIARHDVVGVGVCEYAPVIEHDQTRIQALLNALHLTP